MLFLVTNSTATLCMFDFLPRLPSFSKFIAHTCCTNSALYMYSPFECLPINAYLCLDYYYICRVVSLCLLLMINLYPTGPAGEVSNLGQSLNPGHLRLVR